MQHSKLKYITKYSKEQWNHECTDSLNKYHKQDILSWKAYKSTIQDAKKKFFNEKIYKIVSSNKQSWDLMNWVKKKALPAIKTITFKDQLCNTLTNLWNALHSLHNLAENQPINTTFLNELSQSDTLEWPPFSNQEFRNTVAKCSSFSTPGLDHVSWRHLKPLIIDDACLKKIVCIANTYINLEF